MTTITLLPCYSYLSSNTIFDKIPTCEIFWRQLSQIHMSIFFYIFLLWLFNVLRWSTVVCIILTKKSRSPFSFSSFSFPLFPFPFFLLFHFVPHCLIFHFFSPAPFPPPLAIVFCTIYTPVRTWMLLSCICLYQHPHNC